MENRFKEQQLSLFAERTSTSLIESNQMGLCYSTVDKILMSIIKVYGLQDTVMAQAQCATIRDRLFKIAVRVVVSFRRLYLPSAYPWQQLFSGVLSNLRGAVRATTVASPP